MIGTRATVLSTSVSFQPRSVLQYCGSGFLLNLAKIHQSHNGLESYRIWGFMATATRAGVWLKFISPVVLEVPGLFSSPYYVDIDYP